MKRFIVGAAAVVLAAFLMVGCEKAATNVVVPDPVPSPVASPTPDPLFVVVKAVVTQDGHVTTGVEAGSDFKVTASATQCFRSGEQVACPVIPRWHQRQIGGFEGNCAPYGDLYSNATVWNCLGDTRAATFEVDAEDFDGTILGYDITSVFVG